MARVYLCIYGYKNNIFTEKIDIILHVLQFTKCDDNCFYESIFLCK